MTDFDNCMLEAGLNRGQRKFCKMNPKHNVRLLAPAGSGKTFSLLWRCRFLTEYYAEQKLPCPRILIVTFTRSARFELENRLKNSPEFAGINAVIRTLNAWGWEQNKKPNRSLYTGAIERRRLVSGQLNPILIQFPDISAAVTGTHKKLSNQTAVMDAIDFFKSIGFTHTMTKSAYKAHLKYLKTIGLYALLEKQYNALFEIFGYDFTGDDAGWEAAAWEFFTFWKKAVGRLEENNAFTLEDQKYWARMKLEELIAAEKYPQGNARFSYIMIDEFQDINPLDLALVKDISVYHGHGKPVNITIAGDDDQAIFGWRGTTPKYILEPEKYLGGKFDTCILDTNYRSPKDILEHSCRLISYNRGRVPKEMKSAAKGRAYIKVNDSRKALQNLEATVALTHDLIENKGCRQVALIGRKQTSLFPYQVLFSAEKSLYHVAADIDIFAGEAMNSLIDIIKTVYRARDNDNDSPIEELLAIIGKIDRFDLANSEKTNIEKYLSKARPDTFYEALEQLRTYPHEIKKKSPEDIYKIVHTICSAETVYDFMKAVEMYLTGLAKDYIKKDRDNHYKDPQFFRITELSTKYGSNFRMFYNDLRAAKSNGKTSRERNSDDTGHGYLENQEIKIHLLTATRAKGLEFDAVIILDADDNEWPNRLTEDMEEERRLFYVAMTRARKYLYFNLSSDRLSSRFLLEAGLI